MEILKNRISKDGKYYENGILKVDSFIIEKCFQDGGRRLREKGIQVESLARIKNE